MAKYHVTVDADISTGFDSRFGVDEVKSQFRGLAGFGGKVEYRSIAVIEDVELPTTPGSLVRDPEADWHPGWALHADGTWRSLYCTNPELAVTKPEELDAEALKVVFDAGKADRD